MNDLEKQQYSRQLILPGFGAEKQQLLKDAKVLVVGAGGLGCPVLQYLSGAGVGTIGIMDGDRVDISNLHRQVLYTHEDINQNKAVCAAKHLLGNNPHVDFDIHEEPLTNQNALEIIPEYDVVVDGTDNFETRYLINDACVMLDKPFVYGAISKFDGQVSVFNYQNGPTYRCLFPEPPAPGSVPGCAEAGVLGVLPGMIGTYQALETIKIITGLGKVRSGELLIINTLENNQYTLRITVNPKNKKISRLSDYEVFCGTGGGLPEMTAEEFQNRVGSGSFTLLDVREPGEVEAFNIGGTCIPLGELPQKWQELPEGKEVVVICETGKRSATAAQFLLKRGVEKVRNLRGGLKALR